MKKNLLSTLLIVSIYVQISAQESARVSSLNVTSPASVSSKPLLSQKPQAQELTDLFVRLEKNEIDINTAYAAVAEKGDAIVPALKEILFSDSLQYSHKAVTLDNSRELRVVPKKKYSLLALQIIGSKSAYDEIIATAATHLDPKVKGSALSIIGQSYYEKTIAEQITPTTSIIRLLLMNVDDSTEVSHCDGQSVGSIARQGLKNWCRHDLGSLSKDLPMHNGISKKPIANREFREKQSKSIQNALAWNQKKKIFEISGK